jgi:hypothetical protein
MKDLIPLFRTDSTTEWETSREKICLEAEIYYEETLRKMKKDLGHLVYLCSPLKPTKQKLVQDHISQALLAASQILGANYNGKKIVIFIPHLHLFSVYNEIIYPQAREKAIKFNNRLIREHFHTLIIVGNKMSEGMAAEIKQAQKGGVEAVKMEDFKKKLKNLPGYKKSRAGYRRMISLHNKIHGQRFLIKE